MWLVAEPGHVFSWLVRGSERWALIDTGLGLANIRSAGEPVAGAPPLVVNSHVHFDHVGGNELFAEAVMHELAPERIAAGCDQALLASYVEEAEGMGESWERLRDADREGWFVLGHEQAVRPWPAADVESVGWRVEPPAPTRLVADGDVIDLGDRELRVIHTPGHAAEHICLLDEREGILWAQDQAYYGPQLLYLDGSDPAAFARSARRLADEVAPAVRTVLAAHCLRPSVPPAYLGELADAAESVAAGEAELSFVEAPFSGEALGADFGHFSILVPRPGSPLG